MKIAILAVGTELTTGQIINRNAAWISERLVRQGAEIALHECVPDDRPLILGALERCAGVASLIFVTGGLGPTTDDFTRDVVAEWGGLPMEFHPESWERINTRLSRFGVRVAESNRQQCHFPKGARILANSAGTADGFVFDHQKARVWVLPGPPYEIAAIWNDHKIDEEVRSLLPANVQALVLHTWDCLGKSEAELGEITEAALTGSGLTTGYRAHRPYIEIKVWVPQSKQELAKPYLAKLEKAIASWLFSRGGEDIARSFLESLRGEEEVQIFDACTMGLLTDRLGALLRKPEYVDLAPKVTIANEFAAPESTPLDWVNRTLAVADEEVLTLAIGGITGSNEWAVGFRDGAHTNSQTLTAPFRGTDLERPRAFAVETALKFWNQR